MATDDAYQIAETIQNAEIAIEKARRGGALILNLRGDSRTSVGKLTALPTSLSRFTELLSLDLAHNALSELPDWINRLNNLQSLNLAHNKLTALPNSLQKFSELRSLDASHNCLTTLPPLSANLRHLTFLDLSANNLQALDDFLVQLRHLKNLTLSKLGLSEVPHALLQLRDLKSLDLSFNNLRTLPDWLADLPELDKLNLESNRLTDLPGAFCRIKDLEQFNVTGNPFNLELAAAYKEGSAAVRRYLLAKAGVQVVLNEAKLILIGEGEVGKSSLLSALRDEPWTVGRPTTHGIEIKPIIMTDSTTGTEITLNGWDFGGQRVYRPTHQLFFSTPAVYLVVWKPREGSQQGLVNEWIKLVKHRAPDAKIIVVATHGGPKDRQPDIQRQKILQLFGEETVVGFIHVDSKPDANTGERRNIAKLREEIARVAVDLPEMGRQVPQRWYNAREKLRNSEAAYLTLEEVLKLCRDIDMDEEEARLFVAISHRLGHLIHYEHDPALENIIILKPDWLATAISLVLDDIKTREAHGLVSLQRLHQLWSQPAVSQEFKYDVKLQPLFLRLMERFDLSYKVAIASEAPNAISFWQQVGSLFSKSHQHNEGPSDISYTSLIAQLVPDFPPAGLLNRFWSSTVNSGEKQQVQICRIIDERNESAAAEGLFYQLIVRLHKFSLGRLNYDESVHWQCGLLLDDDYNGRALLEQIGNDVQITVRAQYPEAFLAVLTREVRWLVENFWKGLRCVVMVPCIDPCGRNAPGTGLYEVGKLIDSKKKMHTDYPCPVCNEWQNIDCLIRNAPSAQPAPLEELLARIGEVMPELKALSVRLSSQHRDVLGRFERLDAASKMLLSKVDASFNGLMQVLVDEAAEGPRLFSLQPVDRSLFSPIDWVKKKFVLTLWCEHSRLPLSLLDNNPKRGVYELGVPREWFIAAAPSLKILIGILNFVLPIAAVRTDLALNEDTRKVIQRDLKAGIDCVDAMLKEGEKIIERTDEKKAANEGRWVGEVGAKEQEPGGIIRAQGWVFRSLQELVKSVDPSFGGLVRVQNKRHEFLWVHEKFANQY
jgi:GTPase SAR1 family protein